MKHLLQKIAAVSLSVLMLVSLNSCGTNKGYAPAKGATWADLCRYFESEWFEALPADVQTQYDNLLLGQSPKKYQDSENEETNSAAIKTEDGEQEYSVFSSDDGIIYGFRQSECRRYSDDDVGNESGKGSCQLQIVFVLRNAKF